MTTEARWGPGLRNGEQRRLDPPEFLQRSLEDVGRIERREDEAMPVSALIADRISAIAGSMPFVVAHAVWFAGWITLNVLLGDAAFDPFPFGFLTFSVSLEAIFLAIFVLMSQNRQALLADRRTKVDLQLNAVAEQEITKLISLVDEIHDHMGIDRGHDDELVEMQEKTRVEQLAEAIDERDGDGQDEDAES